jgi:hypothetical protein
LCTAASTFAGTDERRAPRRSGCFVTTAAITA